jgi:hypothetical protein
MNNLFKKKESGLTKDQKRELLNINREGCRFYKNNRIKALEFTNKELYEFGLTDYKQNNDIEILHTKVFEEDNTLNFYAYILLLTK